MPSQFSQLIAIHPASDSLKCVSQPAVFVLMKAQKTFKIYERIFTHVKNLMIEEGLKINLEYTMTDFETAIPEALKEVFRGIETYACYFHLAKNIRKNSRKIEGKEKLSDDDIWIRVRSCLALSMLQPDNVNFSEKSGH